ncbi:PQQ-binding-like beta-propeller repeat protein [Mariniblastus sp.]|nr:PQQ-binding-like beta-propeller repeat protein [Mariniblastus sp.]
MNDLQITSPQRTRYRLQLLFLPVVVIAASAMLCTPATLIAQSAHKTDDTHKPKVQWTQFRGTGNGHADPTAHPPVKWDADQIAWETEIPGTGWSSPVYQGKRAWLTSAITTKLSEEEIAEKVGDPKAGGGKTVAGSLALLAICIDLETGELIHNLTLDKVDDPQPINPLNSYASPTPAIADGKVICHFGTYGTWCLDVETGEKIWDTKFPVQHGVGPGSSPIICDNKVIITSDGTDLQYVAAADLETGEEAWKTDRPPFRTESGDHRKAYSTPLAIEVDGATQLVIPGAQWIVSYDPADGKELWRVDHGNGFSTIPMAVFEDDLVICPSGYPLLEFIAVNPKGSGDVTKTNVVWRKKSAPGMPCYLASEGNIYAVSNKGVLFCLDAKTGEELKRIRVGGNFSASPLLAGGNLYLGNREGKMTVVECSPKLEKLGTHDFEESIMASPIVVGDDLLIRTEKKLIRIKAE